MKIQLLIVRLLALCMLASVSSAQTKSLERDCVLRGVIRGLELTESTDLELFVLHESGRVSAETIGLDGRFTIGLGAPGRCSLVAIADLLHSAHAIDVDVPAGDSAKPQELRWQSAGSLRGVVRLASGEVASNVKLTLRLAQDEPSGESSATARLVNAIQTRYTGLGRSQSDVVTDANGRFVAQGLRTELWHVDVADREGDSRVSYRLTAHPVALEQNEHEFVWSRHQLRVQLRGMPWSSKVNDELRSELHLQPATASETVSFANETFSFRPSRSLPGRWTDPGTVVFDLVPECDYDLVWARKTSLPVGKRIRIPLFEDELVVTLLATSAKPVGKLVLHLPRPAGAPRGSMGYQLVHVPTGLIQQSGSVSGLHIPDRTGTEFRRWISGGVRELRLPEGDYDLTLRESSYWNEFPIRLTSAVFATWRDRICVVGGETLTVTPRLDLGARIRLSLTEGVRSSSAAQKFAVRERRAHELSASVTLRRLGRVERKRVVFEFRVATGGQAKQRIWDQSMQLRQTCESVVLDPGLYRLSARLPDGRESSQEIEILYGETLDVSLEFGVEPIVLPYDDL